jgi:hypothetical protein
MTGRLPLITVRLSGISGMLIKGKRRKAIRKGNSRVSRMKMSTTRRKRRSRKQKSQLVNKKRDRTNRIDFYSMSTD